MGTFNSKIGKDIRARRNFLRSTQADLAWNCGVHRSYIARVEQGTEIPSLDLLEKIATVLNMPTLLESIKETRAFNETRSDH